MSRHRTPANTLAHYQTNVELTSPFFWATYWELMECLNINIYINIIIIFAQNLSQIKQI